ncbi:hypothetical protein D3C76_1883010 [compost metagenome]
MPVHFRILIDLDLLLGGIIEQGMGKFEGIEFCIVIGVNGRFSAEGILGLDLLLGPKRKLAVVLL